MEINMDISERRPAFGILTMDDEEKAFRGNRRNFTDIWHAGSKKGVEVYVVTVKDLHLHEPMIQAHAYDPDKERWKPVRIQLPHVLYNRIPYRDDERQPEVRAKLNELLRHPDVIVFNPTFFNKWSLMHWLRQSAQTKRYVPSTRRLKQPELIGTLLRRHPVLYLKPERGKAGRGIMRVRKRKTGRQRYLLYIQDAKLTQTLPYKSLSKLCEAVTGQIDGEDYIIQQAIPLVQSNCRPYDLRLLMQKNKKGIWRLSGIGARVAGESSITTHVPRGGYIDDPHKLLRVSFGPLKAERVMKRVKLAASRIVRQIEKASNMTLGEMSLDIGVDAQGAVWFFEANSKPMKFDEPEIRERSLNRLIDYASFLKKQRHRVQRTLPHEQQTH